MEHRRRPPIGPPHTFVVYEKKTGAIRGVHHLMGGPAPKAPLPADSVLTAAKQRRASEALKESVTKSTASLSGAPAASLAVLELRKPMPRGAASMRVDPRRRRLVAAPSGAAVKLPPLGRRPKGVGR